MLIPTPPMGWNTWNTFGANISEALEDLEQQADQEELRLLALDTVQSIGYRVLQYELAA